MRMGEIQRIQFDCQDTQELMVLMLVCPERLSIDERIETSEHLAQCPSCRQEYAQMKFAGDLLIQNCGYLRKNGEFDHTKSDNQAAEISHETSMDELFQERLERAYIRRKRRVRRERIARIQQLAKPISAIAACLVLGIGLFFGVQSVNKSRNGSSSVAVNLQQNPVQIELISGRTTEIIPAGQSIMASDALKVLRINGNRQMVLNVGTALKIEPYNLGCLVKLDHGEIYTEVEHDGKPFIVETIHGRAVITGTIFNIKAYDDSMELAVLEGTVRFESDKGNVEVGGGNQSVITSGMKPTLPVSSDTESIAKWVRQKRLPELPGAAASRWNDATDLPGTISLIPQSYNLEEIDFDVWIEQHREWFEREFPWTIRMQKLLAEKGIQVDTIDLLIESGDLWQFAWPQHSRTRILSENTLIIQPIADRYGVNIPEGWIQQSGKKQALGAAGLHEWLDALDGSNGDLTLDSIHTATFLLNTRSLTWFAIKNDNIRIGNKQQVLDLLTEQVKIVSNSLEILDQLLMADTNISACSTAQYNEYIRIFKDNISAMIEIEKRVNSLQSCLL